MLAGAAASPASVKMLRSQTSPSSVLDTLQPPPHAGGDLVSDALGVCALSARQRHPRAISKWLHASLPAGKCTLSNCRTSVPLLALLLALFPSQMSIVESPRNPEATRCLFDLDSPSLGTLSVLGSTQQGQQHDVLRGLASAQNGPLQGERRAG